MSAFFLDITSCQKQQLCSHHLWRHYPTDFKLWIFIFFLIHAMQIGFQRLGFLWTELSESQIRLDLFWLMKISAQWHTALDLLFTDLWNGQAHPQQLLCELQQSTSKHQNKVCAIAYFLLLHVGCHHNHFGCWVLNLGGGKNRHNKGTVSDFWETLWHLKST